MPGTNSLSISKTGVESTFILYHFEQDGGNKLTLSLLHRVEGTLTLKFLSHRRGKARALSFYHTGRESKLALTHPDSLSLSHT